MNILMVNTKHPSVKNISGVRAWRLSQELAAMGHKVVLVTTRPKELDSDPSGLSKHEWSVPHVLAIPSQSRVPEWVLGNAALRKASVAVNIALRSGNETQWVNAAEKQVNAFRTQYRPDVIWATFGALESLHLGRRLSRRLKIPWIADVKDGYLLYVPRGVRRLTSLRLRSASAVTANSPLWKRQAEEWLGRPADLIYSGVDDAFWNDRDAFSPNGELRVQLVGGLHSIESVREFLVGMSVWFLQLPSEVRARCVLNYAGTNTAVLRAAASDLRPPYRIVESGYVSITELASLCRTALAACYIWHPGCFSSKLLELIVAGRPIIVLPGELQDSVDLATRVRASLNVANDRRAVAALLGQSWQAALLPSERAGASLGDTSGFRWRNRAQELERVMERVARRYG